MASSKYERELKFIHTDTRRLERELEELREVLPDTPADAEKKAARVNEIEETIAQMQARRKEIEDSFRNAGMEVPDISKSLNENGCRDTVADSDYVPQDKPAPELRPRADEQELTAQIGDITDELMQIEIKMLRADVNGDESEKTKLQMSASALRGRRDSLVAALKELKEDSAPEPAAPAAPIDDGRLDALEADNRALRSQIGDIRSDIMDLKEELRQVLDALRMERSD